EPIDTTGAGDLFASGFLHGYLAGNPLEECARWGTITGAAAVLEVGAEIPAHKWPAIGHHLASWHTSFALAPWGSSLPRRPKETSSLKRKIPQQLINSSNPPEIAITD